MGFLSRFRRRHEELDKRVASATARAQDAAGEVRKSQVRQEAVREHVVEPLLRASEHNQFADLIRRSLTEGHGRGASLSLKTSGSSCS
jgi:hypothetical protein